MDHLDSLSAYRGEAAIARVRSPHLGSCKCVGYLALKLKDAKRTHYLGAGARYA